MSRNAPSKCHSLQKRTSERALNKGGPSHIVTSLIKPWVILTEKELCQFDTLECLMKNKMENGTLTKSCIEKIMFSHVNGNPVYCGIGKVPTKLNGRTT